MQSSTIERIRALPPPLRAKFVQACSPKAKLLAAYDWDLKARDTQREPSGDWTVWLILAGRGFGKSRTGAEFTRKKMASGKYGRWALVGRTTADVRDVMVEGESGILATSPPWFKPKYEPSKRRLTWPNGAIATTYSADEPDLLRGPQHDGFWADELAAWPYEDTWDQLQFGLRLGKRPCGIVTTTPRPTKLIIELTKASTTHVTRGSTYDNRANLAPSFFAQIIKKYEGTRLGRQELLAEILTDIEGALWKRSRIDELRVRVAPELKRVVVAIDPAVTATEGSDETGIVVAGLGVDNHGYTLADYSLRGSPHEWASQAIDAYIKFNADRIVAEVNNGGDMVEHVIRGVAKERGLRIAYKEVRATRGKQLRAEPVSALTEQGIAHHVGTHAELEDQKCTWVPGDAKSPDRLDAEVWAFTELMIGNNLVGGMVMSTTEEIDEDLEGYEEEDLHLWR